MNFILIYELTNREYNNLLLLKCELEERGHKVYLYDKCQDIKLNHIQGVALIPNSSHSGNLDAYRYKFNLRDNPIVIYSCEQLINHSLPNDFDYSDSNPVKKLPIFCWGKDYRDFMVSIGMNKEWVKITGAIQLDYCRERFSEFYDSRNEIASKYNLPLEKKWVLFISDFVYASEENYISFSKAASIKNEGLHDRYIYENETQKKIVSWLTRLLEEETDYIVIYRKHPAEIKTNIIYQCEKQYNGCFYEISDLNIKQWIFVCDKISCYYSTAAIESSVAGKECLLLRPDELPYMMKEYFYFEKYPKISNYESFKESVRNESNENIEIILNSLSEYYDISETPSYSRVADELEIVAKKYERNNLENNYTIRRLLYLIKTNYIIVVFLKRIFRLFYRLFGYKPKKERNKAIKEWINYAENKRNYNITVSKIKKILSIEE